MPNVLHLTNSFRQGGTERQAVQLTRLMHESGRYRPYLACLDGCGPLRAEIERLQLGEIQEFRLTSFYDANAARQVARLVQHLRQCDIAVVHTHDFYTNVLGMAAASLARVPARIASRRDTIGFRTPAQSFIERGSFRLAHAVIVNARAVYDFLIDDGVAACKIATVYNGVDMKRVTPPAGFAREAALAAMNLPSGRRFVTIVANMEHEVKDHPTFLRAARGVRDAVSDVAFVLAGEGRLLKDLRAYAGELRLGSDVFFIEGCERVAELLAVSDVCVLSSKAEGFSNSILEYMAAARPVVVTDVGGAREVVGEGETGFLVAPGDAAQMADRITLLLSHQERARTMGERARLFVRERFSCELQLQKTESLYDRLLCQAGKAGTACLSPY